MQSRRDQLQAYRFMTRRIVSGLLMGEPETNERPMRRLGMAIFGGALIAILIFAGVGIYGFIKPGGAKPAANALILERESGAKFLYLDGRLHPVLNWTSARLIVGGDSPTVKTMSQASLRDIARGRPVGIAGLPDALPASSALLTLPWSVCTAPRSTSSKVPATFLFVGAAPDGGSELGDDSGLLVTATGGPDRYLIYRGKRLLVKGNATMAALGWAALPVKEVGESLLNALPVGPDLSIPAIRGKGQRSSVTIGGAPTTVGQLFQVSDQYYIVLQNGLTPIGAVTAQLMRAEGAKATVATAAQVGQVLTGDQVEPAGFPAEVPDMTQADTEYPMMCALYRGSPAEDQSVSLHTYAAVDDEARLAPEAAPPAAVGADGVRTADRVVLPGGRASLVWLQPPPGAAPGTTYLITDQGYKYPMPIDSADAVKKSLGYEGVTPVSVPANLLALVPTGPALDPEVAKLFVSPPAASVVATPSGS